MSNSPPQQPPLGVWLGASLVALVSMLALGNLHRSAWLDPPQPEHLNLARLEQVPADALHVVALGSSKTRCALDFDATFAARLDVEGRPVVFHRIAHNNPTFAALEPALSAVARARPDVLLLEDDLLLFDRNSGFTLPVALNRLRVNFALLRARLTNAALEHDDDGNWGRDQWIPEARCRARTTPAANRVYADWAATWRVLDPSDRAAYLDYLRPMQSAGTQIILVDLPRSPVVAELVPSPLQEQVSAVRRQLSEVEGFGSWTPGELSESEYCDHGHMNERGREQYSRWLATRLEALFS